MLLNRRQFSKLIGAASAPLLPGCSFLRRPLDGRCFADPSVSNPAAPLAIDMHVHVFNATDIPVKAFLENVMAKDSKYKRAVELIAPILERIGWDTAPTAKAELERLALAEQSIARCETEGLKAQIAQDRQAAYKAGRDSLISALNATPEFAPAARRNGKLGYSIRNAIASEIEDLPEDVLDYRKRLGRRQIYAQREIGAQGAIAFILQCFQYRYVNVFDYLDGYSGNAERSIDLMVCHMVDYDWPIAMGRQTATSFRDQNEVMGRISALTGGRVHSFAAFDPFKEVAFAKGLSRTSPLELLKEAVARHGCVGAKLYPPMGFAPYGNAKLQADNPKFWAQKWFRADLDTPDLGKRLDEALAKLYGWCVEQGVPVMAHTNVSLGPAGQFEELATAPYWGKALEKFKGLRVSFGHFGDTDIVGDRWFRRAEAYANLMHQEAGAPGEFAYADSAYFAESLSAPNNVRERLRELLLSTKTKGKAALAKRLMYGTDWEMLTILSDPYFEYLSKFVEIFDELAADPALSDQGKIADQFFGLNAATLLGLHRNEKTRLRLESFYARKGVRLPLWMHKLDQAEPKSA
ncbi:MAG: hypothetical protein E5X74_32805 [Mesorhizobium sp.]|nr:MAG: hypothetical protein EOR75_32060 [Mesorhizobium sp.]TIO72308.1 MAG: hypothetical protein E5X75_33100 [Mesorhizobium sp.]TIO80464.1 MAG: hypothetical protein E5X74_32805 [Mesorhizobium sp.]TJV47647.1 MAG: hypothetical protein E5Y01_31830 [Mesorhizobium sp.]